MANRDSGSARPLAAALAIALLAFPAYATIWIVDANNGPGTNFTTISAAVAASLPGDRILVKAGVYNENVDVPIGISITGWNATHYPMNVPNNTVSPALLGTILVHDIPVGQTAIVSGLVVTRPTVAGGLSMGIVGCSGPVVLDRLIIANGGVLILNSTDILIQELRIRQSPASDPPVSGLVVSNSWVQANDLDATATDLGTEPNFYPIAGSALEVVAGSVVALARPRLIGATGGGPWTTTAATPGGGSAIRASGGSIVSVVDDTSFNHYVIGGQGGSRGAGSPNTIPSGNGGPSLWIEAGSTVLNKGMLNPIPGQPGVNNAGGPLGFAAPPVLTLSGSNYMALPQIPAVLRVFGSTQAAGPLIVSHQSAGPLYPVGLCFVIDFDLTLYVPSVQFLSGNPLTQIYCTYGTSNAARQFNVPFSLPTNLTGVSGAGVLIQSADDVSGFLFLANPAALVVGF